MRRAGRARPCRYWCSPNNERGEGPGPICILQRAFGHQRAARTGPGPEWMWGDQLESCWYLAAKMITCPKETANQVMMRTRAIETGSRGVGQGHLYLHPGPGPFLWLVLSCGCFGVWPSEQMELFQALEVPHARTRGCN